MALFDLFEFVPYVVGVGCVVVPVLFIWVLIRIFSYTETDKNGRRYCRKMFYPGRICPGCGLRVLTDIPTCPSCERDFSQDSEGKKNASQTFMILLN